MTRDNWDQFRAVFEAALALPTEKRAAYLDQTCPEPSMRAEVDSLLFCYQSPQNIDEDSAGDARKSDPKDVATPPDPLDETFIDHYQIIGKVGEQGSQAIHHAVCIDGADLKQVVMRLSKVSTNVDDFRALKKQRMILMGVEHPNIAGLLDAGIDKNGCSYLVMEHVEGIPVIRYCDLEKLSTRARIELFLEACRPLRHAHEHFVAHGSITSESVIVGRNGTPVVLDLGISSLVEGVHPSDLRDTRTSLDLAALEHASPEQIRGEPITAADDVYSLGVLLYRLLAGRSPYQMKADGKDDLLPAIFEASKPSEAIFSGRTGAGRGSRLVMEGRTENVATVRKLLAGDLDNIILKAIRKDSRKRYQSVEQFVADLQRYLENRPVSCRENTFLYRAGKLIKRHKGIAATAGCGLVAVILAFGVILNAWLHR